VCDAEPDDEGSLEITKTVTGGLADENQAFTFTVIWDGWLIDDVPVEPQSILLKDGETAVIEGIPAGVSYTVTETPVAGYTAAVETVEGEIVSGQVSRVPFHNHASESGESELTITKIVEGAVPEADRDKVFEFTVLITLSITQFNNSLQNKSKLFYNTTGDKSNVQPLSMLLF
jgi:hypothetical protein